MCYAAPPIPQTLQKKDAKERREKRNKKLKERKKEKKRMKEAARATAEVDVEGVPPPAESAEQDDGATASTAPAGREVTESDRQCMFSYLRHMLQDSSSAVAPTEIQSRVWPLCLGGYDVRAKAETGTGKTFGYMFPLLYRLGPGSGDEVDGNGDGDDGGPRPIRALVLVPTRELAKQVLATATKLRPKTKQRGLCLIGGISRKEQTDALAEFEPDVVIGTPGRLCDLIGGKQVDLSRVEVLVIDEADKMLQMGFDEDLQKIQAELNRGNQEASNRDGAGAKAGGKQRQTLLFSATFPKTLLKRCKQWLAWERTRMVNVGQEGGRGQGQGEGKGSGSGSGQEGEGGAGIPVVSSNITQIVHVCAEHKKEKKLLKYLDQVRSQAKESPTYRHVPKILVFVNTIKKARTLFAALHKHFLPREGDPGGSGKRTHASRGKPGASPVGMIHGKRSQQERSEAIQDFKSGKTSTLIATDIVGRGIHIPNLNHVVLYDFPPSLDQYVHRVGRTGRHQDKGESFAFFTRNLAPLAPALVDLLRNHQQKVDPHLVKFAQAAEEAMKIVQEKGIKPKTGKTK